MIMGGIVKSEVIKPAGAFAALDFVRGILNDNKLIDELANNITKERQKSNNNSVPINANELRENLIDLSKSLHNQLASHLDKWIQNGLTVEPANPLPKPGNA